jgi:hypothetical protein
MPQVIVTKNNGTKWPVVGLNHPVGKPSQISIVNKPPLSIQLPINNANVPLINKIDKSG